ncbi:hypothetical protein [Clostridium butyricum]|uniref:hypothetical protein n=1 Tax=Clostridium butyricum TaxID=1492 RepID=UPI00325BA2AC
MELTKFGQKLNKLDGNIYTIEEEVNLVNGVYEADLEHDNINVNTLSVYTGSMCTGDKINTYKITTPSLTPWRKHIKIYSTEPKLYIVYETAGDTIEADDINDLQDVIGETQTAINEEINRATNVEKVLQDNIDAEVARATTREDNLKVSINAETTRGTKAEQALQTTIDTNKPIWDDKYTKAEIDNKISQVVSNMDWKESVATYADIAKTYPNPQDGWTVNVKDTDITYRWDGSKWIEISANAIPLATASNDGKMSKEDKSFLDTVKNLWTSITTHISDTVKHITSAERTLWNTVSNKLDKSGGTVTGTLNVNNAGELRKTTGSRNGVILAGDKEIVIRGGHTGGTDLLLTDTEFSYGGNTIYHAKNLTKVSQLNNDAGYITQADVDTSISPFYVATESSPNVYKVTTGESLSSLKDGYSVRVAIPTNATGNISITIDSITVPVKLSDGTNVSDFKTNGVYSLTYYNGNFICASAGGKSVDMVTFTSDKLLTGYTANNSDGKAIEGTMVNNGSPTATLNCDGTYNIQEGYYSGGTITANSLASQTADATAGALQIVPPYTAYVNGQKVTGTMNVMPVDTTSTDGVYGQANANNFAYGVYSKNDTNPYVYLGIPQWSYTTKNSWVRYPASSLASNIGLTADKIVAGNTILGVTGTAGGGNIYTGEIKKTNINSSFTIEAYNIPFTPKVLIITGDGYNNKRSFTITYVNKGESYSDLLRMRNMDNISAYKGYNGFGYSFNYNSSSNATSCFYSVCTFGSNSFSTMLRSFDVDANVEWTIRYMIIG